MWERGHGVSSLCTAKFGEAEVRMPLLSTHFLSGFRYVSSPHQAAIHLGSLVSPRIWWGADEAEAAVFGFSGVCVWCECIFHYACVDLGVVEGM